MNRDVADLLKCLPDRKFPYRIFDAASGQVLRSVSGDDDQDTDADDVGTMRLDEGSPAPAAPPPVEIIELRTPVAAPPPRVEIPRAPPDALPRMVEVPVSARAVGNILPPSTHPNLANARAASAAGAIAAMVAAGPQPRSRQAPSSTRSLLAALRTPGERPAAPAGKSGTAQMASMLGAGAATKPSTAQMLGALATSGTTAEPPATPRTTGRIAALLGARGAATADTARAATGGAASDGSTRSMLRGVLRR